MDEAIEPNASYVARLGKEDPAGISSYGGYQLGSAATRRSAFRRHRPRRRAIQ
jgi:hypothetical protein